MRFRRGATSNQRAIEHMPTDMKTDNATDPLLHPSFRRNARHAFAGVAWKSCSRQPNAQSNAQPKCTAKRPAHKPLSRRQFTNYTLSTLSLPLLLPPNAASQEECCSKAVSNNWTSQLQEWFANDMETLTIEYERQLTARKTQLFSLISTTASKPATIADIGIGTGPNLKYYPKGSKVIGIEPNPHMWPYAQAKSTPAAMDLNLVNAVCEHMPLQTGSCDVVVTTTTLCSVTDVQASLAEINRILKPGGVYLFIEHVLAPPSRQLLRSMQMLLNPLQVVLAEGCHLNRETGRCITSAFEPTCEEIHIDYFDARFNNVVEDTLSPIRPHISGYVRKAML